jgi:hypothetical protein
MIVRIFCFSITKFSLLACSFHGFIPVPFWGTFTILLEINFPFNSCLILDEFLYLPPLWSSGQSSWPRIQKSGFDSQSYKIFLKNSESGIGSAQPREYNWGATWKKSSGSGIENRDYGRRDPSSWSRDSFCPQKLALIALTSGGRWVGIVRWRTKAMGLVLCKFKTR